MTNPAIWTQTLHGRVFDLMNPSTDMVDFAEIADTLANINRYSGASEKPISVAQHTLMVFDAVGVEDRAAALLHDAHEAYIGDITTPTALAIGETIYNLGFGRNAASAYRYALAKLKASLDATIWAAAGVTPMSDAQIQRIKIADLSALITERRDFLAPAPRPWGPEIEEAKPLPRKYRYRAALDVADELHEKFKIYLPALRRSAA